MNQVASLCRSKMWMWSHSLHLKHKVPVMVSEMPVTCPPPCLLPTFIFHTSPPPDTQCSFLSLDPNLFLLQDFWPGPSLCLKHAPQDHHTGSCLMPFFLETLPDPASKPSDMPCSFRRVILTFFYEIIFIYFYWDIAYYQCCDSFRWISEGLSHTHTCIQTHLPSRLPHDNGRAQ